MKIADLEDKVELHSLIAQDYNLKKVGANVYRVDPCPVCGSKEHFTIYPESNSYSSFSHCCQGGSVYKYLQEVRGMDAETAYKALITLAGEELPTMNYDIKIDPSQSDNVKGPKDLTEFINELYQKQTKKDREYFIGRGIHPQDISKFKLSIFHDTDGKRAVFPIWEGNKVINLSKRALDGQEAKYKNSEGPKRPFNMDCLNEPHNTPIIITEGVCDALTLIGREYPSISLNSVEGANEALERIRSKNKHDNILITAFDNDAAGQQATKTVGLPSLKIPAEYKDLNEWAMAEIEAHKNNKEFKRLVDTINTQLETLKQPDNAADFLLNEFDNRIEGMKPYKDIKTGFANLDSKMGGFYPGLYIVGALPSLGKTTFALQIADNRAKQGDHVLYFSLEMGRFEMISKSLARETAENNLNDAVNSLSIRNGSKGESVERAKNEYMKYAKNVSIVERSFSITADEIRENIERYIKMNGVKPFIVVDYLQLLKGTDDNMSDKQRVEQNVMELKKISMKHNLAILLISSFNRQNYLSPVGLESFKESGGIEYTADVIWGLQYAVMGHDDIFLKESKAAEKRAKIKEAKADKPRQIELTTLKNRFGLDYDCTFSYWSKYDYFESNLDIDIKADSYTFSSDFNQSGHDYKEIDRGHGVKEIISTNRKQMRL